MRDYSVSQWQNGEMTPPAIGDEIRTARLLLRCKRLSDAPLLKRAIDMSLDHLRPWMPWAMHEPSELSAIEARIAGFQRNFLRGADWSYGIFNAAETELLGGAALHPSVGPDALELGYWLRADCTGKGIATEAAAALTETAFSVFAVSRVEIHCDPKNLRSARIPERLGYRLVETLIANTLNPAGEPRDTMVWAIEREPFEARRDGFAP